MNRLIRRANSRLSIGWAAALLSATSFFSMFLSLFRERLLNAYFGVDSILLDAYRVAFQIPDFMFFLLVSGALSVTFIPVISERLAKSNKASAWDMSSSLLTLLSLVTGAASLLMIVFAGPIVRYLIAPDMADYAQDVAVTMMRIVAINPFLFAISSVLTSIQQAFGRFFFYALAPAVYNLSIIFGIVELAPRFGIVGVTYGVVIGSFLQLAIGLLGMIGLGFTFRPRINWRNHGFRRIMKLLPQRSADQGLDYFVSVVETAIAARLGSPGPINEWAIAYTLHWVPVNLIGIAISTAAFPRMSERLQQGRSDLFKKELVTIIRAIIWLALPAVVIAFFARGYLVRLLIADGNALIAQLLGLLTVSIFFRAIFHLASRSFYAQQDVRTPLKVSIVFVSLNIFLAAYLAMPFGLGYGVYGLALAQSFVAMTETLVLLLILERRYQGLFDASFFLSAARMFTAGFITAVITYLLIRTFPLRAEDVGFFTLAPKFALIVTASLLSYLSASYILGVREAKPLVDRAVQLILRPIRI